MTRALRRWPLSIAAALAVLAMHAALAFGRDGDETWNGDAHQGTTARVVIPLEQRQRNTGGSDGAGLCVIASMTANGRYQGVPNIDRLWEAAKLRPGGYAPDKFDRLVQGVLPGEKFGSFVGTDPAVVQRLNRAGYPVGVTMNTGRLYNYQPIHHMVSLVHHDGEKVAVVDNNMPDKTVWMTADTFNRRWIDGGTGWALVWDRLPLRLTFGPPLAILFAGGAAAWLIHVIGIGGPR